LSLWLAPELLRLHACTPANSGDNLCGHLRQCPFIDREFHVGDISGIQDRIQLPGSRQMPRKASRISGMSLPKPSLHDGEWDSQATDNQGHSDRRRKTITILAALAYSSHDQAPRPGCQVVRCHGLEVAQFELKVERVVRRCWPAPTDLIKIDYRVLDEPSLQKGSDHVGSHGLSDTNGAGHEQRTGGHAAESRPAL